MKKILMGSAVLTAFSLSIIAFQMSCSKSANAQTGGATGLTQLGKILIVEQNGSGLASFYTVNYDGSNKTLIPFSLPTGYEYPVSPATGQLSPDGKTLFIDAYQTATKTGAIFSCSIDGSNLKATYNCPTNSQERIQGAY